MKPAERPSSPMVSDEGTPLTPRRSETDDLEIVPIEPPPYPSSRPRRKAGPPSKRAETPSVPDDLPEAPRVERPSDAERARQLREEASEAGRQVKVVFGPDNRVLVTPTTNFPNSAICRLAARFPLTPPDAPARVGTGSFIDARHVLTAGHVIFNAAEGGWATRIRVVPGLDGGTQWFGSELLVAPNFIRRSVTGWTEDQDIDYDWGLLTLNTGFPQVGSFGLLYASDDTLDNTTAYLTGYPGDRGSPRGSQQFGVPGGGKVTDYDSTLVYYAIDTSPGQSGSGVYTFWEGKRAIIAVHGGQYDSDENRGARITKVRHDLIRAWQVEDGGLV